MTRIGLSSYQQPLGTTAGAARRLPCSLTLSSCRKYAALRDKIAEKAAIAAAEEKINANKATSHKKRRHTASR